MSACPYTDDGSWPGHGGNSDRDISVRNDRGRWCVHIGERFISDHRSHDAARKAARQLAEAEEGRR